VGIGTSSPTAKLDVVGGAIRTSQSVSAGYSTSTFENSASNGYVQTLFNVGSGGANGQATISYAPSLFFAIGPATNDTTTPIVFRNNNATERMRIDSSGNVGIGVVPSAWSGFKALQIGNGISLWSSSSSGAQASYYSNNLYYNGSNRIYINTGSASEYVQSGGIHYWYTASSGSAGGTVTLNESMRIDTSGNLLVNVSNDYGGLSSKCIIQPSSSTGTTLFVNTWGSTGAALTFYSNISGAPNAAGSITLNGGSTAYNTSSDYRLKENVAPMTGALARVAQLNPVTYQWKLDGSNGEGFIAHELQAVVPDCVTGKKDAVNEDGTIKPQGIDTSFLVATLTAAIQEQQAMIETLTTRLNALESK
jgi:hypothetical protein